TVSEVGLSLGSNVGDKVGVLGRALERLASGPVRLTAVSSFYRTEPWGHADQDWFVNLTAIGETTLAPVDLLHAVKAIEAELGRRPTFRFGPREIDIDLLWAGEAAIATAELTLPHPAMFERAFVLVPLAEIAANRSVGERRIGDEARRFAAEPIVKIAAR